jgi:hypothetical protein
MVKNKMYILFLILGIACGVFFGLAKAKANTPEGKISQGEQPASVYYDEFWQATDAVVSTDAGYRTFSPAGHSLAPQIPRIAAELSDGNATIMPKLVVRKWTVHGHIHFK